MNHPFVETNDNFNVPHFQLNLNETIARNISAIHHMGGTNRYNIATLVLPLVRVERRVSGRFQTDLTTRDDVLLAFLSLIVLLLMDSIIAAFLLRSRHGAISNFSFSVKQVIELLKDFSFRSVIPRRKHRHGRKINVPLLLISSLILMSSLGVEVAILFLTNSTLVSVSNRVATFRISQPIVPEWSNLRFHARVSINRPCEPALLLNVEQASTGINGCTESTVDPTHVELFEANTEETTLKIVSDFHDYGADHYVSIGNLTANYSTRVVFVLGDGRSRFMRSTGTSEYESKQVEYVHLLFVAYSFSLYARSIPEDKDMNLTRLRSLIFSYDDTQPGLQYDILRIPNSSFPVNSRRYITEVSGVIPDGSPILRVAQHHFRAAAALVITDPDQEDLFLESGIETSQAEVWQERVRVVNWLSLFLATVALLLLLFSIRTFVTPASTPDIASVYVKHAVGADPSRSPMEISNSESNSFRISFSSSEISYRVGAETDEDSRCDVQEEYA